MGHVKLNEGNISLFLPLPRLYRSGLTVGSSPVKRSDGLSLVTSEALPCHTSKEIPFFEGVCIVLDHLQFTNSCYFWAAMMLVSDITYIAYGIDFHQINLGHLMLTNKSVKSFINNSF